MVIWLVGRIQRENEKKSNDKEPVVEIGKFVQGLKLVKLEIVGALSKCILYYLDHPGLKSPPDYPDLK
jgi:hypothetical protein